MWKEINKGAYLLFKYAFWPSFACLDANIVFLSLSVIGHCQYFFSTFSTTRRFLISLKFAPSLTNINSRIISLLGHAERFTQEKFFFRVTCSRQL
jgi:hypothetical protein